MKANPKDGSGIAATLGIAYPPGRRSRAQRWLIVAIPAGVVVVIALVLLNKSRSSNGMRYKTHEVQRGDLTVIVTATGILKATNQVDASSELSGFIKSVEADYISKVQVGQPLTKLVTTKLEVHVTQSKAALESAKAEVLQAQATVRETRSKPAQLRKVRELSKNKVPSQTEIDAAEAAFDRALADVASARASVSQSQATLEANQTDLSKAVIRSPVNGIVLIRSGESGQTVAATLNPPVLFTLAEDLTKMELIVNVDKADVGHIREGQKATFSVAAYPNRTFEAHIVQERSAHAVPGGGRCAFFFRMSDRDSAGSWRLHLAGRTAACPLRLQRGHCLLAFLFSAAVGVIFGYFPALKAARPDPIEALRHE